MSAPKLKFYCKKEIASWAILATWKADIRRIMFEAKPGK
jgi:hypothetical protein